MPYPPIPSCRYRREGAQRMSGLDRPWEMGEGHLIALINSVRETLTLDYKQSDALDKSKVVEISKDISSFANSAGGTIIYGMEELDKTGYPKQIDGGVDPKKISAEWLNDIISSNIRPPLQGVRINPVSLDTLFPGKVAYVIYIPQSHDAHQAADKK